MLCRIARNQEFCVTRLPDECKCFDQILNAFAGCKQSEKQNNRLTRLQTIALVKRIPVMILRKILAQPAGIPVRNNVCSIIWNKRKQRQKFFAILPGVKEYRRKVPVDICVGAHCDKGKKTSLILAQLKFVAD